MGNRNRSEHSSTPSVKWEMEGKIVQADITEKRTEGLVFKKHACSPRYRGQGYIFPSPPPSSLVGGRNIMFLDKKCEKGRKREGGRGKKIQLKRQFYCALGKIFRS